MIDKFLSAEPFPHLVLDDTVPAEVAKAAADEFDRLPSTAWHTYSGHDEAGKRACRDWGAIEQYAPTCHLLLRFLVSSHSARIARLLTGIESLESDETLYGGGLHAMPSGSHLGLHADNEIHPQTGFLRRLNAILYLRSGDGGHLELWPRCRSKPSASIAPVAGRMVLMETVPYGYHSVSRVVSGNPERRSLAVYYWSAPRARARFLSSATERPNADLIAERAARSQ